MKYVLGIDTGGTNTDCAILNSTTKEILYTSKAPTTHENLEDGISRSIDELNFCDFHKIEQVSLSTTLATNSIVEGTGCETGILLTGAMPDRPLPSTHCFLLSGKLDIKGREKISLSEKEITKVARSMKGLVDAVAISGYASVRNPEHELRIKKIVEDETGLPTFCAHELSGSLGFWERTVTTALNASLIKIIRDFIAATKKVLKEKGITAPIMIVRSDGSLMSETVVLDRPVETILSGPAASILGAKHLIKSDSAYIFDMGGTTSDIADLDDGKVNLSKTGAKVGGWLTRCRAAEVSTHGIGGDSLIIFPPNGIVVGPERVIPLCTGASLFPHLTDEISLCRDLPMTSTKFQAFDCFLPLNKNTANHTLQPLSNAEKPVFEALDGAPHTLEYICRKTGFEPGMLPLESLLHKKCIQQISFTPTDLVHVTGEYRRWDSAASELAMECISEILNLPYEDAIEKVSTSIIKKLVFSCLQSAADFEKKNCIFASDPAALYLMEKSFSDNKNDFLHASFKLTKPIAAVGAPVSVWMPHVADKLGTELIIPEHSEVANAIGAAVAPIRETAEALIRPALKAASYAAFLPDCRKEFSSLEEAIKYSSSYLKKYIRGKMSLQGVPDCHIDVERRDAYTEIFTSGARTYIETHITAEAVSSPVIV